MIRSVVTFLNKWYRYTAITPTEIITNKYPGEFIKRAQMHDYIERAKIIKQQKVNAEKANATELEVQFINLREEYKKEGSKMTQQQYEQRLDALKQRQHEESLKSKSL